MIGHALRLVLFAACLFLPAAGQTRTSEVTVDALPREARQTLELIRRNGPFPYDRDGIVFGNRERILPQQPRGYYREYTVRIPGTRGRGAHRIVCGGDQRAARDCWYSDDHYVTFRRIR